MQPMLCWSCFGCLWPKGVVCVSKAPPPPKASSIGSSRLCQLQFHSHRARKTRQHRPLCPRHVHYWAESGLKTSSPKRALPRHRLRDQLAEKANDLCRVSRERGPGLRVCGGGICVSRGSPGSILMSCNGYRGLAPTASLLTCPPVLQTTHQKLGFQAPLQLRFQL